MTDDTLPGDEVQGRTGTGPLPGTRDVIVLEPGGEQAQKIAKAMGSQTAGDILQLLKTGPKTSTEVTDQLGIPMGTAKYHIENLLDAGLIEVTKTKYSVKGREVKVYGLKDQLLIVTPRVTNVRALLLKYASLFGVIAVATVVIGAVLQFLPRAGNTVLFSGELEKSRVETLPAVPSAAPLFSENAGAQGMALVTENGSGTMDLKDIAATMAPTYQPGTVHSQVQLQVTAPAAFPVQEVLIAFFLGGCLVIAGLVLYDIIQREKNQGT